MALIGVDANATQRYVLVQERKFRQEDGTEKMGQPSKVDKIGTPIEGATVFVLGTITSRQRADLIDSSASMEPNATGGLHLEMKRPFQMLFEAVRIGLKDWEGLVDVKGNELKIKRTNGNPPMVSYDSMDYLHSDWVQELGSEIVDSNKDNEEEGEDSAE